MGIHENRKPDKTDKQLEKRSKNNKGGEEHTKSAEHVNLAFSPSDNCFTPDFVNNHERKNIDKVCEVSRSTSTHPHPNLLSPFLPRFPFQRDTRYKTPVRDQPSIVILGKSMLTVPHWNQT